MSRKPPRNPDPARPGTRDAGPAVEFGPRAVDGMDGAPGRSAAAPAGPVLDPKEAAGTVSLVARRLIRAPEARVFSAWTDPAQLLRWWGPAQVQCVGAELDLRVGGRYRLGNRFPDGKVLWIVGEFEQIRPPRELVYTWALEPGSRPPERVTVRFEPREGGTEVTVLHERIAPALLDEHTQGWQGCLDGLERLFLNP